MVTPFGDHHPVLLARQEEMSTLTDIDFDIAPPWFVVLPDHDAASPVCALVRQNGTQQITHSSGRPWIVGQWAEDAVTVGEAGHTKIALIGQHAITAGQLDAVAARIRVVADLDRLAATVTGCSHLVASVGGQVRFQGTITGIRRVFHARRSGVTVASDRGDVLACLLAARIDEQRLALHLLVPTVLYPLAGRPVWQEVAELPGDHYLVLGGDGTDRSVRWWAPPQPVVPLAEGASALREALFAAIAARVRGRELVSCDLGGLDSTAVCSVAAHHDTKVVAYTFPGNDPLADDAFWATRTVAGLGGVEHHVIPTDAMPLVYQGVLDLGDRLDEPCPSATERDRVLTIVRRAAARGSRLHLTGFGGDELLYGSVAHLHSLLRTRPLIAMRYLRGFAVKYRWPLRDVVRQLLDARPYREWLNGVADHLTDPAEPMWAPLLDWGFEPRMPPWATRDAVDAVREAIRVESPTTEPLARRRGQHRELEGMRHVSRIARQFGQMAAPLGVVFAAPYYDDRVIEVGLSVRPEERVTPWQYKPLIREAMRGVVPEESRTRSTKANSTCDVDPGLRDNRAALFTLCDDSRLAQLGLVDAAALRHALSGPLLAQLDFGATLDQTVACEVWLRSLERTPVPT